MDNLTEIKIEGVRTESGGTPELTTQFCRGDYHFKDGFHYLTYGEKMSEGEKETKAIIKTDGKTASLLRFSGYGSNMNFNPSKPQKGRYKTPFGDLDFEIVTHKVTFEIKENNGRLFLEYSMNIAGQQSENTLKINFNIKRGN